MPDNVIDAQGLEKRYGSTVAVSQVDLVVERGHVHGILGPNGSGKSTTVRMLLGLAKPDAGEVRLFGEPVSTMSVDLLRRVGSVVETPSFVPYLSGRHNLQLLEIYTPGASEHAVASVLDRVHLVEAADRRFKTYSLGMKQRLGIAAALLTDPELVILDEPTNGLDPQGTREVRELIPELAAEGRTVLLCSHLLAEVELVCDAVTIFQRGRVVAHGLTRDLIGAQSRLEVRVPDIDAAEVALRASRWGPSVHREDGVLRIDGAGNDGTAINELLVSHGQFASVLRPVSQSLEDVFFELTGQATGDG
ncbi:MAG: ABC transporter ATP-binding protein [Tepidiformaceae bacterium]